MPQPPVSARPAVEDDFEQMLAIEKACYPQPWSENHFYQELQKPYSRVLVLTDDETDTVVLGYIVYWIQAEGVSLHNIAVDPKWRGMGLARRLLQLMINETVRDEIPRITLEVRESNTSAITLYKSIGFRATQTRQKFYNDGESAVVMELKTSDLTSILQ